jgi:hypothetical protein
MNISFKIRGVKELQKFLSDIPRGTVKVALKAFTEYVIGNESHGLKHSDSYKYVSGKQAGYVWSKKQIRFFFATGIWESDGQGGVKLNKYDRTGKVHAAWDYVAVTDWNYTIINPEEGAYWTRDNKGQARMPQKANWRKQTKVILDNMKGGIRSAIAAVNNYLKTKGNK